MKIKTWMLAAMLAISPMAQGATNDLTNLLQQGLFEEEANRNLDAAILDYQSLASAFDKDRQLAATAIFRLGECYRKLGKTNEAVIQYQRIVREFNDQQTLVTLSQQNLTGLNSAPPLPTHELANAVLVEAQANARLLEAQLQQIESMTDDQRRVFIQQNFPNPVLNSYLQELDLAQQKLITLRLDYTPDHPKFKAAAALVEDLDSKVEAQVNGVSQGLRDKLKIAQMQMDLQKKRQAEMGGASGGGGSSGSSESATTDEEQTQIRNIQAMIQNSPDLINAPNFNGLTPLQQAAFKGQLVVAKYLLDHGADVDKTGGGAGDSGGSPLYLAANNGHKSMVELLLARGANVNSGFSPLNAAVSKGFIGVVDVLLAAKADVNGWGDNNGKVIHTAVSKGNTNLIQLLIAHGADVNATNYNGNTPLHLATDENVAHLLIAAKANVEARNKEGNTPLHEAAKNGHAEIVSLLLQSGAVVDATNNHESTPLFLAANAGNENEVRALLKAKADPNHLGRVPNGGNSYTSLLPPIYPAIWQNNHTILKLLLESGANPEGNPQPYESPLYCAIDRQNVDSARLLLEHGANPNRPGMNGMLPLRQALINEKNKPIIPLLLEKGANPNALDSDGLTPLFLTTDPELVRALIDHKADVNARDRNGRTPIMHLSADNFANFTKILVEAGAKTDLQDTNGNTALHFAVFNLLPELVTTLLEHKANPNIQNDQGYTPLDLAKGGSNRGLMLRADSGNYIGIIGGRGPLYHFQPTEAEQKIIDLLVNAGGLANLPKRDRIEVRRGSHSATTIYKDSSDRNHYSLLETIAITYGILNQNNLGDWVHDQKARRILLSGLSFPNFKQVTIYRRDANSGKSTSLKVDADEILSSGDCSKDIWLEWGDIVEIPETDHPVDERWEGLSDQDVNVLIKCETRQVTVKIKGESTSLKLAPEFASTDIFGAYDERMFNLTRASFMLRSVLDNSKLIRVSSDLSRVKVARVDPETKKKVEWTIDCTDASKADLWLRDGDVVEVPEK